MSLYNRQPSSGPTSLVNTQLGFVLWTLPGLWHSILSCSLYYNFLLALECLTFSIDFVHLALTQSLNFYVVFLATWVQETMCLSVKRSKQSQFWPSAGWKAWVISAKEMVTICVLSQGLGWPIKMNCVIRNQTGDKDSAHGQTAENHLWLVFR